jgi:hypothetical protein
MLLSADYYQIYLINTQLINANLILEIEINKFLTTLLAGAFALTLGL